MASFFKERKRVLILQKREQSYYTYKREGIIFFCFFRGINTFFSQKMKQISPLSVKGRNDFSLHSFKKRTDSFSINSETLIGLLERAKGKIWGPNRGRIQNLIWILEISDPKIPIPILDSIFLDIINKALQKEEKSNF